MGRGWAKLTQMRVLIPSPGDQHPCAHRRSPGLIGQLVPCVAAVIDDVVVGLEDPVRQPVGQLSSTISNAIGQPMTTTPMWTSSETVWLGLGQIDPAILAGDDWLRSGLGRNLFFILMCRARLPNRPMPGSLGFGSFANRSVRNLCASLRPAEVAGSNSGGCTGGVAVRRSRPAG